MSADNENGAAGEEKSGRPAMPSHQTRAESSLGSERSPRPNYEDSLAFLQWHSPQGPWCLCAIPVDKKGLRGATFRPGQEQQLLAWLNENSALNLYFTNNPVMGDVGTKPRREHIASLSWLHVDLDPRAGEDLNEERARILALLTAHKDLPAPSCIIFSGGGYQALWRLKEPVPINGEEAAYEQAKLYNLQELLLGGDSCHNVDRVLRLPGTVNRPDAGKTAKGRSNELARVVEKHNERVYSIDQFKKSPIVGGDESKSTTTTKFTVPANVERVKDLATLPVSDLCKVVIAQGNDPDDPGRWGSRSEPLFWVCCEMVRAGVKDEVIFAIITDPEWGISASVIELGSRTVKYAIRQIERAKEEAVDPWLRKLNDEYAFVESVGGKTRIARFIFDHALGQKDVEFLLVDGFDQTYRNKFIEIPAGDKKVQVPVGKWWLSHPLRRTFKTVTFAPGEALPETHLNLWQGFGVEAKPGDCSLFLAHLRDNVCGGVQEHYDYLIRWMAHAVQRPGEPGQVAIVLRGKKGVGKGFFATTFGRLWGGHFKHVTNPEHLVGKFNAQLKDGALIFADEAFFAGNKRHEQSLKAMVTERQISIELKGVDVRQWRNCSHVIMASNDDWVVPASHDERRYFVLDAGEAQRCNRAYFQAIDEQMKHGGHEALLHHLFAMDVTAFDVTAVPDTKALREQKDLSLDGTREEWLATLLEAGSLPNNVAGRPNQAFVSTGGPDGLYEHARRTCPKLRDRSDRYFGNWLSKKWGAKGSNGSPRSWTFPPLAEMRRAWEAKYGAREWPAVDYWQRAESASQAPHDPRDQF